MNNASQVKSKFWLGRPLDFIKLDLDGEMIEITKYRDDRSDAVLYHNEVLSESFRSLDALLISWIARRNLGLNQHQLVAGICRALEIR